MENYTFIVVPFVVTFSDFSLIFSSKPLDFSGVMNVCVFGSSSKATRPLYVTEAKRLGREIALRGMVLVNGGGRNGVMGGLNDGCEAEKGLVKGIIHQQFCVDGSEHPYVTDMVKVNGADLWERKQLLLDNGDCVIILPGGTGTFDELWECVSGKSLGMKGMQGKPICLVNIDGFYDGFVQQLQRTFDDGLLYNNTESYFHVETDVIAALDWCVAAREREASVSTVDKARISDRETSPVPNITDESCDSRLSCSPSSSSSCQSCPCVKNVALVSAGIILGFALSRLWSCKK